MGGLGSCAETRAERKALNAHILSIHDRDGAGRVIRHEVCVQNDGLSVELDWILIQINGPDTGIEGGLGLRSPV